MWRGLVSDDSTTSISKKYRDKNIQWGDITDHSIPHWFLKTNEAYGKGEKKLGKHKFLSLF